MDVVARRRIWCNFVRSTSRPSGEFQHAIDGAYPAGKTQATMPGSLLARLPQLPDDIEFRFVGAHLILYDVRTNTIMDRLPDAIACA